MLINGRSSHFFESSAIFHFLIESVNIAGFELPHQFRLLEGFWRIFFSNGKANIAIAQN